MVLEKSIAPYTNKMTPHTATIKKYIKNKQRQNDDNPTKKNEMKWAKPIARQVVQ